MEPIDARKWVATDRPGEWLSVGRSQPGVEIMSVRGSTRRWCEPLHEQFAVAAVCRAQPPIVAEWRTRCRPLSTTNGELMAINAGDGHVTVRVNAPAAFDVVHLSPRLFDDALQGLDARGRFRFRSPVCSDGEIFGSVQRVVGEVAQGAHALEVESSTAELVWNLATRFAETPPRSHVLPDPVRDFRVRRLREVLEDGLRSARPCKPALADLARQVDLSVFRMCAVFKNAYGMSIGTYWMGRRVARATQLLVQGVPVREVAAQLEFADEPDFSRIFKRYRGLPPAAWRNLHRANSTTRDASET